MKRRQLITKTAKKNEGFEIHPYGAKLDRVNEMIDKDLSESNSKLLIKYDQHMVQQSLAKSTRLKHLQTILNLSRILKKDWSEVTKVDIEEVIFKIMSMYGNEKGQETNYTYDHKKILKLFFRWFKLGSRDFKDVGDPPETKNIKSRQVKDYLLREELLTDLEYRMLMQAAEKNYRVKALIAVHYEAGTRPSELLSLRLKHVQFDKFGAIISVDGKTGPRKIRILKSIPYLREWINVHPFKGQPDAPLWIQVGGKNYGGPLNYVSAKAILERLARSAGIQKRLTLNLFRHTRATALANVLPESLLRKRQGWTPSSKMPERYVHLVDEDLDEAYLRLHGIIKEEKEKNMQEGMPVNCELCGCPNIPNSSICSECNRPLDIKTAIELEEKEKEKKQKLENRLEEVGKIKEKLMDLENFKEEMRQEFKDMLNDLKPQSMKN